MHQKWRAMQAGFAFLFSVFASRGKRGSLGDIDTEFYSVIRATAKFLDKYRMLWYNNVEF
jgi:hypothetical protein